MNQAEWTEYLKQYEPTIPEEPEKGTDEWWDEITRGRTRTMWDEDSQMDDADKISPCPNCRRYNYDYQAICQWCEEEL